MAHLLVKRRLAGVSGRLPISPDSLNLSYLPSRLSFAKMASFFVHQDIFLLVSLLGVGSDFFFFFNKKLGISRT